MLWRNHYQSILATNSQDIPWSIYQYTGSNSGVDNPTQNDVPMKENEAYATVTVNVVKTLPNEAYGTLSECIKP